MTQQDLRVTTPDGEAVGKLLLPDEAHDGGFPLDVLFVDAGGLRPAKYEMAGHLTRAGHAVLIPDPYWRQAPFEPFDTMTVFSDPPERARLMTMINTMKTAEWIADTEALIGAIDDPRVDRDGPLALVGYCMGGRAAFIAAATLGERVAAVSCIHAGGLVGKDDTSPHNNLGGFRAHAYLGVADQDGSCTPEHQAALREALDAAGIPYQLELYEGARHGFAVPDFPVYDEAAAAKSWERTLAVFARGRG
ncbi:MAG: dienelactone hydrolase family protein [Polyangiaceae bacterium]